MKIDRFTIAWAILTTATCLALVGATAADGKHWTLVVAWAVVALVPASVGFAEIAIAAINKEPRQGDSR